jgi:hypothetical protein
MTSSGYQEADACLFHLSLPIDVSLTLQTSKQTLPTEICHLKMCQGIPGVIRIIDWFARQGFFFSMFSIA